MHYYEFNIPNWSLLTSHLTLVEDAVFRRLLDFYYTTEKPIPKKTQPVIRRLRLGGFCKEVGIILDEFFELKGDQWHYKDADLRIAKYKANSKIARENGKKGGRPKKEIQQKQDYSESDKPEKTHPVVNCNPEETTSKANKELITNNQELITKDKKQVKKPRQFKPPSESEVREYCDMRGNNVDPGRFIDHYEANGWMRGKTKIKCWRACVRTWEQNENEKNIGTGGQSGRFSLAEQATQERVKYEQWEQQQWEENGVIVGEDGSHIRPSLD